MAIVGLLGLSLAGCAAVEPPASLAPPLWSEVREAEPEPGLARLNEALARLAERLRPALVQVRARPDAAGAPAAPAPEGQRPPERRRGLGSGFMIGPDGYLVTNHHVVADAPRIEVRLADGRLFRAQVVGRDARTDLALLKIQAPGPLPTLPLGDSDRARVGEFVLALGNPFGLEQSVSFGIVSRRGPGRAGDTAPGFEFIQTDAAVNPGNSGGPLVNMAGQVIGVNSMASRGGSIGFAIPSNLVKALLPQLHARGRAQWGWLGVGIEEVSEELAATLGLPEPKGVLVNRVLPGQPADRGGIKAKDIILSIDGVPVAQPRDLVRLVSTTPVGKKVEVGLLRDGKAERVTVEIGEYHEPEDRPQP
jgi:serine protease Do